MKLVLLVALYCNAALLCAQNKKLSLEVHYGINGNFFVRNYDEVGGPVADRFYKKRFIGPIGGVEMKYGVGARSKLGLGFSQSKNSREVNFTGSTIPIAISSFNITHINKFFQLYYERVLTKNFPALSVHTGLFYLRMNQQEIEIEDRFGGGALIEERNFKNSKLEEGGILLGVHYAKKIDTRFSLGLKSRVYYLASTSSFEAITLTPTLTYHF